MLILQNNLHTKINLRPRKKQKRSILNVAHGVYIDTVDRLEAMQPS